MDVLGRYHPLFVIGRGGMGSIEVAVERGAVGDARVVALKRMLPGVRDRRHADMFMREARLATLLNHENVVHALSFGEQDGELVIAMEYVAGETLASLQNALTEKSSRVPINVAMWVLAELCEGLHAAHELHDVSGAPLGVVHRDVCPHNTMLSYHGEVKLLDFGVAKLESAHLTKTGEVKGKTAYMSPEQAMGDALDRRSDLYGVGAMLFELVTGRRMWSGETDLELLRQLALGDPPRLADIAKDAPPALCDLHARLVAKKAIDRPASAAVVADMLRATMTIDAEAARASLVAILSETYAATAREKRRELDAALEAALAPRDEDPRSAEPGAVIASAAPQKRDASRVAPWMYGLIGAAIATAAVLFARREPTTATTPSTTQTSSAVAVLSAAPSAIATNVEAPPATVDTSHVKVLPRTMTHVGASPVHTTPPKPTTTASATAPVRSAPNHEMDVDTHPI